MKLHTVFRALSKAPLSTDTWLLKSKSSEYLVLGKYALQGIAAFEDKSIFEIRNSVNAKDYPAQNVVPLDVANMKAELFGLLVNLAGCDHIVLMIANGGSNTSTEPK